MAAQRTGDYQRTISGRNVEAILDAVEDLLERRAQTSISAVAAAWRHLARFGAMAQAVAEQLSPEAAPDNNGYLGKYGETSTAWATAVDTVSSTSGNGKGATSVQVPDHAR
jgi:hypothetical protein